MRRRGTSTRRSPRTHPAPSWTGTDGWARHSAPAQARQLLTGSSATFSRTRLGAPFPCRTPCFPTQPCLPLFCYVWVCLFSCLSISPVLCASASILWPRVNVLPLTKAGGTLHGWSQPDRHQRPAPAEPRSPGQLAASRPGPCLSSSTLPVQLSLLLLLFLLSFRTVGLWFFLQVHFQLLTSVSLDLSGFRCRHPQSAC